MSEVPKHKCHQNWHWHQLHGMRLFREVGRRKVYDVRCGICGRSAEVDSSGREFVKRIVLTNHTIEYERVGRRYKATVDGFALGDFNSVKEIRAVADEFENSTQAHEKWLDATEKDRWEQWQTTMM